MGLSHAEAAVPDHRSPKVPGEPGVWILVLGDLCVFGVLFVAFMHARSGDPDLFNASQEALHRAFGGVNTLLLLTSSLLVVLAVGAIRGGTTTSAGRLLYGALTCAAVFLGNKGVEWTTLISDGHGPTSNDYFMYFFVMTGLHAAHVMFGAALLIAVVVISRRNQLSDVQLGVIESFGCYWHLVDVLWLVIFPLLYLIH